jgi:hypothetical protein
MSQRNDLLMTLQAPGSDRLVMPVLRALVVGAALIIAFMLYSGMLSDAQGLIAYSSLLLVYCYSEFRALRAVDPNLFWINPVVLSTVLAFVIPFGITNVIYFLPESVTAFVGIIPGATPWMNQMMLYVVIAACSMWIGYRSAVGRRMGKAVEKNSLLKKWMVISFRVSTPALFLLCAVSLVARLFAIKLGVYGYSSTYDDLIEGAKYREYLSMADSLGKLSLVAAAIQCFSAQRYVLSHRQILWALLTYEVCFGFLTGFKSAVVMPFIIVAIAYYTQRKRFPMWIGPAIVASVLASFVVIESFRLARNEEMGFSGTSISAIISTMTGAVSDDSVSVPPIVSTGVSFLTRSNLTYHASLGIEYSHTQELPSDSPEFLRDIMWAPVHAVVPRLVWDSKPLQNIGLWYTNEVLGLSLYSSTAMSAITYLNFAGGLFAIVLGFLAIGVLQRSLFDGLRPFGGGGLIVLLGLLSTLIVTESAFNSFIVGIVRLLPALVVAQYVLLQRRPA